VGDFYKLGEIKLGENFSTFKSYLDEEDMPNFLMDFYLEDNGEMNMIILKKFY